jgi:hypothetical protein
MAQHQAAAVGPMPGHRLSAGQVAGVLAAYQRVVPPRVHADPLGWAGLPGRAGSYRSHMVTTGSGVIVSGTDQK